METTTLSFQTSHNHGDLFAELLRARKNHFVDAQGWALENNLSYDQYDVPSSRWVTVHKRDEILAAVRLTPTTNQSGIYSYLIKDAQNGIVDDLPDDLLYEDAPVSNSVWEVSRCFSTNAHANVSFSPNVYFSLIENAVSQLSNLGANLAMTLLNPVAARILRRRFGLEIIPAGDPFLRDHQYFQSFFVGIPQSEQEDHSTDTGKSYGGKLTHSDSIHTALMRLRDATQKEKEKRETLIAEMESLKLLARKVSDDISSSTEEIEILAEKLGI